MKKSHKTQTMIILVMAAALLTGGLFAAQEKEVQQAQKAYEMAKKAIYDKNWNEAIARFNEVVEKYSGSRYRDESLYWLAYSKFNYASSLRGLEQQIEAQQEAVERLNELIAQSEEGRWADDARVLRIKIAERLSQSGLKEYRSYINGQLDEEKTDPDLELKLLALDSLMHMDSEKALPLLEKIIRESESAKLKSRALMVLGQSDSPKVLDILKNVVISDKSGEVREAAVLALGMHARSSDALPALMEIYDKSDDSRIKERVIVSLMQIDDKKASEKLLEIALKEKDEKAQEMAVMMLAQRDDIDAANALISLYDKAGSSRLKERLIVALSTQDDKKSMNKLLEIMRSDPDPKNRERALMMIGQRDEPEVRDMLFGMYDKTDSLEMKKRIIISLFTSQDKDAIRKMIQLARKEKNFELKKQFILFLSQTDDEEAIKFLKEIIEK